MVLPVSETVPETINISASAHQLHRVKLSNLYIYYMYISNRTLILIYTRVRLFPYCTLFFSLTKAIAIETVMIDFYEL